MTRLSFRGRIRKTASKLFKGKNSKFDTFSSTDHLDSHSIGTQASIATGSVPPENLPELPEYVPITGAYLVFQQFYALLIKRCHRTRRNWKGFFTEIILPALFILIGVLLMRMVNPEATNPPPLELTPWVLEPKFYLSNNKNLFTFMAAATTNKTDSWELDEKLLEAFSMSQYAGTRCMEGYESDDFKCDGPKNDSWAYAEKFRQRQCQCGVDENGNEDGVQKCVDGALEAGPKKNWPESKKLETSDVLLNLTGMNIAEYIVSQFDTMRYNIYGGFSFLVPGIGPNATETEEYTNLLMDISMYSSDFFQTYNETNPTYPVKRSKRQAEETPTGNRTISDRLRTALEKANQTENSKKVIDIYNNISSIVQRANGSERVTILPQNISVEISDLRNFAAFGLSAPASVQVWYNNKGWPSSVAYNNYLNNLLLRMTLNNDGDIKHPNTSYGIITYNHPLNETTEALESSQLRKGFIDVLVAIMLILAMGFVPASFVIFLIEDKQSDSKHVQLVSGLKPFIYWLGNYTWDCINYTIPCLICLAIFAIFDIDAYVNDQSVGALLLLLLLYGFAVTPMLYPSCLFMSTPSTAFVLLACFNLFIGSATTIATYVIDMLQRDDPTLIPVNNVLKHVFLIFPQYCFGRGLVNMAVQYRTELIFSKLFNYDLRHNPYKWEVCGKFQFALFLHACLWLIVVIVIEYSEVIISGIEKFLKSRNISIRSRPYLPTNDPSIAEDDDVSKEREFVNHLSERGTNEQVLTVQDLTKCFDSKTAVDHLSFAVPIGQCFGLLGVNGAGKTTTFRMLTGHIRPSNGKANIKGFDIMTQRVEANKMIGYCPQTDCITPLLSGRENLEFFARLRGVPESLVRKVANFNIARMDLKKHADKPARHYSGGNKRKLSVAISFTGEPPLVFLDEPTAGIDPRARRFLWRAISQLLLRGQSVILTTHSMDECEALCTRLAIMVNGRFRCLGSPQHLKVKFGEGYFVNIRFEVGKANRQTVERVTLSVKQHFSDAVLKEWHDTVATYSLGSTERNWFDLGKLFAFLNNQQFQQEMCIADYSVTQCSLDAVFVSFAKVQGADDDTIRDQPQLVISMENPEGGFVEFDNPMFNPEV